MKKQQSDGKKSIEKYNLKSHRAWKIIAISVIVLFALLVLGGAIRAYYFRSSFTKPMQAQLDFAAKKATEKLQSTGANASSFQMHIGTKMKRMHDNQLSRSIMQVSFVNNNTTHIYLVDVDSGDIILHSETDVYGSWPGREMYEHHDSVFPWMMHKR